MRRMVRLCKFKNKSGKEVVILLIKSYNNLLYACEFNETRLTVYYDIIFSKRFIRVRLLKSFGNKRFVNKGC